MINRRPATVTLHREPVLGSRVECRVTARSRRAAEQAVGVALDEIERWEERLSVYRPSGELRRWIDGRLPDADLSPETCAVLQRAKYWETATDGTVSPLGGGSGTAYTVASDGSVQTTGDCTDLRLDAFAKGYIVDRAVDAAASGRGVIDVMVNVGGDIRTIGPVGVVVGIEHPGRPFDNEPPIGTIDVRNAALATSGRSRRGNHLYDGRSGGPVSFEGSAVVTARTLESADAWATALCVNERATMPSDVQSLCVECDGSISDPNALVSATDDRPLSPVRAERSTAQNPRLFSRFFGGALNGASISISNRASSG